MYTCVLCLYNNYNDFGLTETNCCGVPTGNKYTGRYRQRVGSVRLYSHSTRGEGDLIHVDNPRVIGRE